MLLSYPLLGTSTARKFPHHVGWVRNQRIGVTRGPLPIAGLLGGDSPRERQRVVLLPLWVLGVLQPRFSDQAAQFDSQFSRPLAPIDVGNEPSLLLTLVSRVRFAPFHDIYLAENLSTPLHNEFIPLNHPSRPKRGPRYPPVPR